MTLFSPELRVRAAAWATPFCFLTLWVVSGVAVGRLDLGLLMLAVAAAILTVPIGLALVMFALAPGPVLRTLAGVAALAGYVLSLAAVWDIFTSTKSTAPLGLVLLPLVEGFALMAIAIVGWALDGLLRLALRKAAR